MTNIVNALAQALDHHNEKALKLRRDEHSQAPYHEGVVAGLIFAIKLIGEEADPSN